MHLREIPIRTNRLSVSKVAPRIWERAVYMKAPKNEIPQKSIASQDTRTTKSAFWSRFTTYSSLVLACAILIGAFSFVYLQNLRTMFKEDSISYLQEISGKVADNVSNVIDFNFSALSSIDKTMHSMDTVTMERAQVFLAEVKERWGFSQISLADDAGNWTNTLGRTAKVGSIESLIRTPFTGPVIFSTARLGSDDTVAFAYPIDPIQIDGNTIVAIIGIYDLHKFSDILSLEAFSGEGYTHIATSEGDLLVHAPNPLAESSTENLVQLISGQKIDVGNSAEQFAADLLAHRSGFIGYTLNGTHKYMTYAPISDYGWYLFSVVPSSVVDARSNSFFQGTVLVCIFITAILSIIFVSSTVSQARTKKKLEEMAFVDPVTGGNTQQRFELLAAQCLEDDNSDRYALVYSNVEKFKLINDREGREGGDLLLKEVYIAMESMLHPGEVMCRLSADHYALLLKCSDEDSLRTRLTHLLPVMQQLQAGDYERRTFQISFGVYFIEEKGLEMTTMLTRANIARLSIKTSSVEGLRFGVYDDSIRQKMIREKELEERMHVALIYGEFVPFLQPKIALSTNQVAGAEALVRWRSQNGPMIFPDEFIPLFERNGFIVQLDLFVFEHICKMIRHWLDEGRKLVPISVNLSKVNLSVPNFFDAYERIIKREDIPAKYIEFEFTESTVYDNVDFLNGIIDRIHALGATCSMDDFGSSYSSLNMLKDVDVDILKLDKAFFHETADHSRKNLNIIEGIVGLAKKIRLKTVAEGVEKKEQVAFLRSIDCDIVQGYYYAKPMPISEFEAFVTEFETTA